MSQTEKSAYFNALKASGVEFEKHYREYTTDELRNAYNRLAESGAAVPLPEPEPVVAPPPIPQQPVAPDAQAAAFFGFQVEEPPPTRTLPPVMAADPNEMAGQRLNTKDLEDPIRTDETGKVWLQEEVRKPAYPKPRGRRVLKYMDPGVERKQVKAGEYIEEFEIAGDMANARPAEVKITLPSYQVGIYRDPRFPWKVVCYNSEEGFDLDEIREYYGGRELVPPEVKLKYVSNVLCYDMTSVVRAVEAEYRSRVLNQHA